MKLNEAHKIQTHLIGDDQVWAKQKSACISSRARSFNDIDVNELVTELIERKKINKDEYWWSH